MSELSLQSLIRLFHQFDRSVVRLGTALWTSESLLPCTVAEGRVLSAVGGGESVEIKDLRRALSIDAAFLSRIVKGLEARELLVRGRSERDARRQTVRLTDSGRALQRVLDEHFENRVRTVLSPMDDVERDRLLNAMTTICEVVDHHL